MVTLPLLFVFLFGLIVGSFLNVIICRYNTGKGIGGRSQCFTCSKELAWFELVPVISYLFQRGRCRGCAARISWQYPLVEFITGLLFVGIFLRFIADPYAIIFYWLVVSVLMVIAVYDIYHKIIPDGCVYLFILLALASSALRPDHLLAALVLFLFFAALWYFSAGRWMGFGDAKLAIGIGLLLGLKSGLSAVIIAFWLGALVGLALVLYGRLRRLSSRRKYLTIKSEIPFAPFLIAGIIFNLLWDFNVFLF